VNARKLNPSSNHQSPDIDPSHRLVRSLSHRGTITIHGLHYGSEELRAPVQRGRRGLGAAHSTCDVLVDPTDLGSVRFRFGPADTWKVARCTRPELAAGVSLADHHRRISAARAQAAVRLEPPLLDGLAGLRESHDGRLAGETPCRRTAQDVPPVPVRRVVTGRKRRSIAREVWSLKMGQEVPSESLIEADLIVVMEADPRVDGFWAQPETFRWRQKGRVRRYTPDFLVLLTDGSRMYREVKPSRVLERDPSLGGRRPHIEAECARRGAQFEVWTERDIRRQPRYGNAREIQRRAGPWTRQMEAALAALRRVLADGRRPETIGALLLQAGLGLADLEAALALVAHGEIRIDVEAALGPDTPVLWRHA